MVKKRITYTDLWQSLTDIYGAGEAQAIVRMVMDNEFNMSFADLLCDGLDRITSQKRQMLDSIMDRLSTGEPLQYVIGNVNFADRTINVKSGVLIPRMETEELCQAIVEENKDQPAGCSILDIGTGSGCIAITLALDVPNSKVTAWEWSDEALKIAKNNIKDEEVDITLVKQDALNPPDEADLWNIIVSNPPYVCEQERAAMDKNVLDFEPEMALFVPDDDPLLFYRAIGKYAIKALKHGGKLYFEINPRFADNMVTMLTDLGFCNVETKDDSCGKERFIKVMRK